MKLCCERPVTRRALLHHWLWSLPADYCTNCGEATASSGWRVWLWERLIAPFWDGTILVVDPDCDEHGAQA